MFSFNVQLCAFTSSTKAVTKMHLTIMQCTKYILTATCRKLAEN